MDVVESGEVIWTPGAHVGTMCDKGIKRFHVAIIADLCKAVKPSELAALAFTPELSNSLITPMCPWLIARSRGEISFPVERRLQSSQAFSKTPPGREVKRRKTVGQPVGLGAVIQQRIQRYGTPVPRCYV